MNHDKEKQSKLSAFLTSKGFYVALAVCLMASGVASWLAVEYSAGEINSKISTPPISSSSAAVNHPQSGVVKPSSDSSSSSSSAASSAASKTPSSTANTPTATLFVMPAEGEIFNTYSGGELVKSKTMGDWRTHDGIDINCEKDKTVKAVGAGTVTAVENDPLWGNCVTITHDNGIITYYYSLDKTIPVSKGQKVAAGDVIGNASDSAAVEVLDPVHVHFAAKRDGQWIDPTTLIKSL